MPQTQLPFFPEGVTRISDLLAFRVEDGRVTYFNGNMPVFIHDQDDIATFRMVTAQFCVNGNARQAEVARVFGIPGVTVKRAVKRYREEGPKGFYTLRKARGAAVLTPGVMAEAQRLRDEGLETADVARRLELKPDTVLRPFARGGCASPRKKRPDPRREHQEFAQRLGQRGPDGDGRVRGRGAAGGQPGRAVRRCAGLPGRAGRAQRRRAVRAPRLAGGRPAGLGGTLLRPAQGLLWLGQPVPAAGVHGVGAAEGRRLPAPLRPRRMGQAARAGPGAGGAHPAPENPPARTRRPARAMGRRIVRPVDGGGPGAGRRPLRRRPCAGLPRTPDPAPAPLRGAAEAVPAGDRGLPGQRDGRPAVLRRQRGGRPGTHPSHRTGHPAAPAARRARPAGRPGARAATRCCTVSPWCSTARATART